MKDLFYLQFDWASARKILKVRKNRTIYIGPVVVKIVNLGIEAPRAPLAATTQYRARAATKTHPVYKGGMGDL